ncbi:hypothetical protein [Rubrivirga marina]|uniref:Porin domain-containing protein n=1 Tax=Rubrivirga marina TaxID=1196024 RepID=A0A271IYH3_9BACT|nr:hypothetical protein [Rubrivirga marina]PAP75745.1 hypothetical protein BSZ37_04470 [Rubrivirga marina]
MTCLRRSAVLFALVTAGVAAQPSPRVVVEAGAVSQTYSTGDERSVSEVVVPISAAAEVVPGLSVGVQAVYATVSGDGLESLSGLGDTQLSVGYRRPLGAAIVDLLVASSLPTGQTALTVEQFATSAALAVDDFAFALPTLGQGAVVSPGIALAVPAGEGMAAGFGAAYSARSAYTLFAGDTSAYAPANEVILTAGVDASIGGASSFRLEGSYVLYGDDGYRGQTFSPGDRAVVTMLADLAGRYVRSQILARYRHVFDGAIGEEAPRPVAYLRPSQAKVAVSLGFGPETAEVALSAGARYYGTGVGFYGSDSGEDIIRTAPAALAEQQVLVDLGVAPRFAVGANALVRGSFVYTLGVAEAIGAPPLTGYRVGASVRVGF